MSKKSYGSVAVTLQPGQQIALSRDGERLAVIQGAERTRSKLRVTAQRDIRVEREKEGSHE